MGLPESVDIDRVYEFVRMDAKKPTFIQNVDAFGGREKTKLILDEFGKMLGEACGIPQGERVTADKVIRSSERQDTNEMETKSIIVARLRSKKLHGNIALTALAAELKEIHNREEPDPETHPEGAYVVEAIDDLARAIAKVLLGKDAKDDDDESDANVIESLQDDFLELVYGKGFNFPAQ